MVFTIAILDNRNDKSILHAGRFFLDENDGIWASLLKQKVNVLINENDGIWADKQGKSVNYFLNENEGIWADKRGITVDDFLNENDGIWTDLLEQSVDETVRNMFRELIQMKDMPDSIDSLFQSGDLSLIVKGNDRRAFEIPNGVAGTSLADLIKRFKKSFIGQDEMVVTSLLALK